MKQMGVKLLLFFTIPQVRTASYYTTPPSEQ